MNGFKYELQRGGGSLFTTEELNWFQRLWYRIKCYEVIKMDEEYWNAYLVDNSKKTTVHLEIKY